MHSFRSLILSDGSDLILCYIKKTNCDCFQIVNSVLILHEAASQSTRMTYMYGLFKTMSAVKSQRAPENSFLRSAHRGQRKAEFEWVTLVPSPDLWKYSWITTKRDDINLSCLIHLLEVVSQLTIENPSRSWWREWLLSSETSAWIEWRGVFSFNNDPLPFEYTIVDVNQPSLAVLQDDKPLKLLLVVAVCYRGFHGRSQKRLNEVFECIKIYFITLQELLRFAAKPT